MMDAEEQPVRSHGEHDHSGSMGARIIQHYSNVKCICPPGTKRSAEDIVMLRTNNTLIWYHVPCKPFLAVEFEAAGTTAAELLRNRAPTTQGLGDAQVLTEKMLAATLGPDATERQLQKVRNITSTFRCDGPCRGSAEHKDFFWCYLCYGWQHKPCVLFGDEGDRGRPVCNVCYIHAMMHEDERNLWQSKRLAQAAAEALRFLRDPGNESEHVSLAFATKFLASFLSKNRKKFLEFVVNRRRVIRWIKARRGLPQLVYGTAQPVPVVVATAVPGVTTTANSRRARKRRRITKTGASTPATTGDGLDDGDLDIEGVDPDNIVGGQVKQPQNAGSTSVRNSSKRDSTVFEPLVLELSAEDDARNERMRKAAALKARKKAASTSTLGVQNGVNPQQAPSARMKRPASKLDQEDDDENFEDIGIFSSRQEQNLASQKSRPARKSTHLAGQLAEPVDATDEFGDVDVESAPQSRNKGKQRQIIHNDHEDDSERQAAGRGSPTGDRNRGGAPEIICSCIGVTSTANCYKCRRCNIFQHAACASRNCKAASVCKLCIGSSAAVLPHSLKTVTVPLAHPVGLDEEAVPPASYALPIAPVRSPAMTPATAKRTTVELQAAPAQPQYEPLGEAMQQEVRTLCRTVLWDAYCDLPDPNEANEHTSLDRPKVPPPSDWLAEAEKRITIMFEAAGSDKVAEYLRHEFVQWPRNSLNIVKALREFAMWMRLKGPFRRTRRELGLVAEILGFEDKGRYWKIDQKDAAKDEVRG